MRRVRCFLAPRRLRVSCCFGLACVVVCRALGRLGFLARVGVFCLFVLCRARGLSQRGLCRQRFVLRAQATTIAALPHIKSSTIVSLSGGATLLPSNEKRLDRDREASHDLNRLLDKPGPGNGVM